MNRGGYDAYIAKLTPDGGALSYSSYLGGDSNDNGAAIAIDAAGNAYVTGSTASGDFPDFLLPQSNGCHAEDDAFVTKINPTAMVVYSGCLGGTSGDAANAIAVDRSFVYVAGSTTSLDFPLKHPANPRGMGAATGFGLHVP